jgi:hypothetical protein
MITRNTPKETLSFEITSKDHGVLHQALTHYVTLLKDQLSETSDVSYSWSLLVQQLEKTRETAKTLRLKVE